MTTFNDGTYTTTNSSFFFAVLFIFIFFPLHVGREIPSLLPFKGGCVTAVKSPLAFFTTILAYPPLMAVFSKVGFP